MTVELFALCDGAYNYNGKLTIVGTLSDIEVSSFPTKVNMGIAIKIKLEPEETIGDNLAVWFYDSEDSKLPADVNFALEAKSIKRVSYISVAANVQGLPVEKDGGYKAKLTADGKIWAEYTFTVEQKH